MCIILHKINKPTAYSKIYHTTNTEKKNVRNLKGIYKKECQKWQGKKNEMQNSIASKSKRKKKCHRKISYLFSYISSSQMQIDCNVTFPLCVRRQWRHKNVWVWQKQQHKIFLHEKCLVEHSEKALHNTFSLQKKKTQNKENMSIMWISTRRIFRN